MKFIAALFAVLVAAVQSEDIKLYKSNGKRLVLDGIPARRTQFPYQAGLLVTKSEVENLCGGSLISSTRVLTAAHCLEGVDSVIVVLGARILDNEEESQVRFNIPIEEIVLHPQFDNYKLQNDIAMIKLPSEVTFNDYISPIELPEGNKDYVDDTGTITGWGHFDNSQTDSIMLRFANLKIMENSKCSESIHFIIESTMCATGEGNTDGCNGDSGGPLAVQHYGKAVLVGVQSFILETGCGEGTGFARVTSYMPWIESNMSSSSKQFLLLLFIPNHLLPFIIIRLIRLHL